MRKKSIVGISKSEMFIETVESTADRGNAKYTPRTKSNIIMLLEMKERRLARRGKRGRTNAVDENIGKLEVLESLQDCQRTTVAQTEAHQLQ